LGGIATARDGSTAELGGTFQAHDNITIVAGINSQGLGVRLPGTGKMTTFNPDGRIDITASGSAQLDGRIVAGGEIVDYYDATGAYLGSIPRYFDGDSTITVDARGQVTLGKGLVAGKLIDVRGGQGTTPATLLNPELDDGVVLGGNVRLTTFRENSAVRLSADGDLTVSTPAWTQEIVADGFAELASGALTGNVSFGIHVHTGALATDNILAQGVVNLTTSATQTNTDLLGLVADVQAALGALGIADTVVKVRLVDGRLQLTSAGYLFDIYAINGGNAERLGFNQIASASSVRTTGATVSARVAALEASARGSSVTIGDASKESGSITLMGYVKAYDAINLNTLVRASGAQSVLLSSTSLMETLSGGMLLTPAGDAVLEGDLIARGRYADIVVKAKQTLEIRGSLTAQRDILITAGTEATARAGEVSLRTVGTSQLLTLDPGGRIVLTGLNDVVIDSTIGKGNPNLGRLDITSQEGTLTIGRQSGWLETGALMTLNGKNVVVNGVLKSSLATAAAYDDEVTIRATQDVTLAGNFSLKGSLRVDAGGNLFAYDTRILSDAVGQHLLFSAGGNLGIGSVYGKVGGAVVEANADLKMLAKGNILMGADSQLATMADNATALISGANVQILGSVMAGATFDPTAATFSWTGKLASLDIKASAGMVLGNAAVGGSLRSTGRLSVQAASDTRGVGIDMSRASAIVSDPTGKFDSATAVWADDLLSESTPDGNITLNSDGSIWLRGNVSAPDVGGDVVITSRSQVWIDGLMSANDKLTITAGTHISKVAVLVDTLVLDANNQYVSGGTLDTAAGGTISVTSTDSVVSNC
jgi:hypothetical protein